MRTRRQAAALFFALLFSDTSSAGQTFFHSTGGLLDVGWQDREGQPQQLSYRLDEGRLPPLIAYRPARMQEEVLQQLLQQARIDFPEVQFSLARPTRLVNLKSRNADQVREAQAWIAPEQAKLEGEWLTHS